MHGKGVIFIFLLLQGCFFFENITAELKYVPKTTNGFLIINVPAVLNDSEFMELGEIAEVDIYSELAKYEEEYGIERDRITKLIKFFNIDAEGEELKFGNYSLGGYGGDIIKGEYNEDRVLKKLNTDKLEIYGDELVFTNKKNSSTKLIFLDEKTLFLGRNREIIDFVDVKEGRKEKMKVDEKILEHIDTASSFILLTKVPNKVREEFMNISSGMLYTAGVYMLSDADVFALSLNRKEKFEIKAAISFKHKINAELLHHRVLIFLNSTEKISKENRELLINGIAYKDNFLLIQLSLGVDEIKKIKREISEEYELYLPPSFP